MLLDRVFGDDELRRDPAIRPSLRHEPPGPRFAGGEAVERVGVAPADHPRDDVRVEGGAAVSDAVERVDERVAVGDAVLEQIPDPGGVAADEIDGGALHIPARGRPLPPASGTTRPLTGFNCSSPRWPTRPPRADAARSVVAYVRPAVVVAVVAAGASSGSATLTTILPVFSPRKRRFSASRAFSSPSTSVSW